MSKKVTKENVEIDCDCHETYIPMMLEIVETSLKVMENQKRKTNRKMMWFTLWGANATFFLIISLMYHFI